MEQTVRLCGMIYRPPVIVAGTHRMSAKDLEPYAGQYAAVLIGLTMVTGPEKTVLQFTLRRT